MLGKEERKGDKAKGRTFYLVLEINKTHQEKSKMASTAHSFQLQQL